MIVLAKMRRAFKMRRTFINIKVNMYLSQRSGAMLSSSTFLRKSGSFLRALEVTNRSRRVTIVE